MNPARTNLVVPRIAAFAVIACLSFGACIALAQSDPLVVSNPDYRNQLYDGTPTNAPGTSLAQPAAIAFFSGNVGAATNLSTPNLTRATDGQIYLLQSGIGQPVGYLPNDVSAPIIATQPGNLVTNLGARATLAVVASGTPVVNYQWWLNGVPLSGATNAALIFTNAQPVNAGNYSIVVDNSIGSVTSSVCTLTVVVPAAVPVGLVGWWPGEGNANDLLGTSPGAFVNGATTDVGKVGSAFYFDGVDDFVSIPSTNQINFGTGDFTVEFWVKFNDLADNSNGVLGKDNYDEYVSTTTYKGWLFNICNACGSGGFGLETRNLVSGSGPDTYVRWATGNLQVGQWYHVAGVRQSNVLKLFVNGILRASATESVPTDVSNNGPLGLGLISFFGSAPQWFNGWLDEVTLYNRALTTNEVAAIYGSGFAGKTRDPLILAPPQNVITAIGGATNLSVTVSGTAPVYYQWFSNGSLLSGATNATLSIPNIQLTDLGNYAVYISNSFGSVTSAVASVTAPLQKLVAVVNGNGQVQASPSGTNYYLGQTVTFTATAGRWYQFVKWSDGVTNNPRTVTVGLTNLYTAVFTNTVPLETVTWTRAWEKVLGGSADDFLSVITPTPDGGYMVGGNSTSGIGGNKTTPNYGGQDYWVLKLDASGNVQWEKDYGGSGTDYMGNAGSILVTSDGGYLLGGSSDSTPSGNKTASTYGFLDYWVIKVDANGNRVWDNNYGWVNGNVLSGMAPVPDGGYLLSGIGTPPQYGFGYDDIWVAKIDSAGNQQWSQPYGGTLEEYGGTILAMTNGTYLIGATSASHHSGNKTTDVWGNSFDYWIFGINSGAGIVSDRVDGSHSDESLSTLALSRDGGSYLELGTSPAGVDAQHTMGNNGGQDWWVLSETAAGSYMWQAGYGGTGDDYLNAACQLKDKSWILAGTSYSGADGNKTTPYLGNGDWWFMQIDQNGQKIWEQAWGGSQFDNLTAVVATMDGGFLLGGYSSSGQTATKSLAGFGGADYWLVKMLPVEQPIGTPVVRVNGQYSPSNSFAIPATNVAQISLQTTFTNGYIYYTLDGSVPIVDFNAIPYSLPGTAGVPFTVTNSVVVTAIAFSSDDTGNLEADADPVSISIVPVYTLTNPPTGGGSVALSPSGNVYLSNTVVTCTAMASNGWVFMGWQGASVSTNNPITLTLNNSTNISAIFGTTIAATTNIAGASIAFWPPSGPYPYGSTVRCVGVPPAGKYFNRWFSSLNGPTNSPLNYLVLSNNSSVSAFFQSLPANNFSLTVLPNGPGTVTRSPGSSFYPSNTAVQITAVPDTGYPFGGWSGSASGSQNPLNVVMNSNKVITATFAPMGSGAVTNQPPLISISTPAINDIYIAQTNVVFSGSAMDTNTGGSISNLILFTGTNLLATTSSSNFNATYTNAPVGTNTFTVIATDNFGLTATSSVSYVVLPSTPQVAFVTPANNSIFYTSTTTNVFVSALASDADNALARVEFYNGGTLLNSITNYPYQFTWSNVTLGSYTLTARAVDSYGPTSTSTVSFAVSSPPSTNPPIFAFLTNSYAVSESNGVLQVTVTNYGDLSGSVNYQTSDVTAHGGSGFPSDYVSASGSLSLGGHSGANIPITIIDNFLNREDITFRVSLAQPSSGTLGNPSFTTVTIHENDGPSNSFLTVYYPTNQPAMNGSLKVNLLPNQAAGQWRFGWDLSWRTNGQTVSGLVAGDYPILFRSQTNYLAEPDSLTVTVTNGGLTILTYTNFYATYDPNGNPGTGSLTVNIPSPGGAGWRFIGESGWRPPNSTAVNLLPDTYFVEFEPVLTYVTPSTRAIQINGGQGSSLTLTYASAGTVPGGLGYPAPVLPASAITDYPNNPYGFNGQLQTDVGFGSGVAVRENVVLTAAHMVFNDQTLSFVSQAWWSFQKEVGQFQPEPLAARRMYILGGYASQRTNDINVAHLGVEVSSPQSRNQDVAVLYFSSPCARNGFGGYVSSDVVPNPYLTGAGNKFVVGYPVDGSAYSQTVTPGTMYVTQAGSGAFLQATDQVYTSSSFVSYPGNSGGPVYVPVTKPGGTYYYPAAVYLGTLANSVSVVRAIDSNVVYLINLAASNGDTGTNNGGGVVLLGGGTGGGFDSSKAISPANKVGIIINIFPPQAVQSGAGWRITPRTNYLASGQIDRLTNSASSFEFKHIPGWIEPPTTPASSFNFSGSPTTLSATYTLIPPVMVFDLDRGLGITGTTGTVYEIQRSSSLAPGSWVPFSTNTINTTGFNLLLPPIALTNQPAMFYRALWLQ